MSDLNPAEVYGRYCRKELGAAAAVDYLKSIIESGSEAEMRVRSVELIGKMDLKSDKVFAFLEHLATSDASEAVRLASLGVIIDKYIEQGINLLKWAFEHEESVNILSEVLKSLQSSSSTKAEEIISLFKNTIKKRYEKLDFYEKEFNGRGQLERRLGLIQPYLLEGDIYYELIIEEIDNFFLELKDLIISNRIKNYESEIDIILNNIINRYKDELELITISEQNKIYKKIIQVSKFGICFNPKNIELWYFLGLFFKYQGKVSKAIQVLEILLEIDSGIKRSSFNRGIDIKATHYGSLSLLARLYSSKGNREKAIWILEQIRNNFSDEKYNWEQLGYAYYKNKEYKKAIESYDKALELFPRNPTILINLAMVFFQLGEYNHAIQIYQEIFEIDNENIHAYNELAEIYLKLDFHKKAHQLLITASKIRPRMYGEWKDLALVFVNLELYDEALQAINKAIELLPENKQAKNIHDIIMNEKKKRE